MEGTFMQKWGWAVGLVIAIVIVGLIIGVSYRSAHAPGNMASSTSASSTESGISLSNMPAQKEGTSTTPKVTATQNRTFADSNWSIAFTLRPQWNVHEFFNQVGTSIINQHLHQVQIAGSDIAMLVSQNEAIGLSDDLQYTTSTKQIDDQSVQVRTYTNPSSGFAFYELFTLTRPDGTYSFLIKSTTPVTTESDLFVQSISNQ